MFGAMVTIYLTFVVVFAVFHEELAPLQNFFFYLGLPSSNLETARSIISLAIAVERVVVSCTSAREISNYIPGRLYSHILLQVSSYISNIYHFHFVYLHWAQRRRFSICVLRIFSPNSTKLCRFWLFYQRMFLEILDIL